MDFPLHHKKKKINIWREGHVLQPALLMLTELLLWHALSTHTLSSISASASIHTGNDLPAWLDQTQNHLWCCRGWIRMSSSAAQLQPISTNRGLEGYNEQNCVLWFLHHLPTTEPQMASSGITAQRISGYIEQPKQFTLICTNKQFWHDNLIFIYIFFTPTCYITPLLHHDARRGF